MPAHFNQPASYIAIPAFAACGTIAGGTVSHGTCLEDMAPP
jgi:hypothetical protein